MTLCVVCVLIYGAEPQRPWKSLVVKQPDISKLCGRARQLATIEVRAGYGKQRFIHELVRRQLRPLAVSKPDCQVNAACLEANEGPQRSDADFHVRMSAPH